MKKWGLLMLVMGAYAGLCEAADSFQFVSVLSQPIASFKKVETKSCEVMKPRGEFNIGSEVVTGGQISILGDPIQVADLHMEHMTNIQSDSGVQWLVDTLSMGPGGEVKVKHLVAGDVDLQNRTAPDDYSRQTTLTVTQTLQVDDNTYTKEGSAANSLQAGDFNFRAGEESEATARWKIAPKQSDDPNYEAQWHPIFTDED